MPGTATGWAGLRLLPGGAEDLLERTGWDAPAPLARPAERCEPWSLDRTRATAFLRAAREGAIALELAAVVTVERCLLEEDLDALGRSHRTGALDAAAAGAAVSCELSEHASAYLATLNGNGARASQAPEMLALPMRLRERIGSRAVTELLDPRLLASGISWERAAVLSGRTMSEWALMTLAASGG